MDHGFGDRILARREYTHPRADSDSRLFAAVRERTIIGRVLQVHIIKFLGKYGIEIQISSTTSPTCASWVARDMGSPRRAQNRRRRTRVGPEPACVRAPCAEWHTQGKEGRMNVLPWYRLVGVASTSSETQGGKTGLPARASGRHVVRGRQSSSVLNVPRQQARLVKTVKIKKRAAAHPGQDRRLPGVVTHPRP